MSASSTEASALEHLEWSRLAQRVFDSLASVAATHRLAEDDDEQSVIDAAVLPRHQDVGAVRRSFDELRGLEVTLEAARECPDVPHRIGPLLSVVLDVVPLLERAQRSSPLDVEELCMVADLVVAADDIAAVFRAATSRLDDTIEAQEGDRDKVAALQARLGPLAPPGTLRPELDRSLERGSEPRLSDAASPQLGGLRRKVHGTRQGLTTAADRLVRKPEIARALADSYWTDREGRVVLPVRTDAFSRAGSHGTVSGIIHGSSKTGATLFVEPQALVEAGNAWREATVAVRAEERRILAELSGRVGEASEALAASLEQLVWLDQLHARLEVSRILGGLEPDVFEPEAGRRLEVEAARHPVMSLAELDVVPNDLHVDHGGALIISGPNAGGKTVALKTLGLCVLMAQAGLRIPTSSPASVPLFRNVVTDVGDDQSIVGGLSTFSAHMGHVRDALEHAAADGPGTLVLLDEVAVGTDPEQGAALAEALLRELVERGATLVITTHYERLKLLASEDSTRFSNAAVGFDFDAMRPTFTVRMGAPGASSALTVARRLGLPDVVLDRARAMLDDSRLQVDALLRDVEAHRERLASELREVGRERRALDAQRASLEQRERREEETAASKRAKAHAAATSELRSLENEIKRRRKALRKSETSRDKGGVSDGETREFARDAKESVRRGKLPVEAPKAEAVASISVGDRVFVAALGLEGQVLDVKGDKVRVQLPLAKVTVRRDELGRGTKKAKSKPKPAKVSLPRSSGVAKYFGTDAMRVEARHDNVIDVRGNRADEAVVMLEVFCDRAIAEDVDVVIVRHGYGTGALRKAVREHLAYLPHIKQHRSGLRDEGGEAVTVVWINP
ncbi:MAG: endonuclease MutS2 [Nannocystales bacterium]